MSVQLDHTICAVSKSKGSSGTACAYSWCAVGREWRWPFLPGVRQGLTLDMDQAEGAFPIQHYCFRMSEAEFDALLSRLQVTKT